MVLFLPKPHIDLNINLGMLTVREKQLARTRYIARHICGNEMVGWDFQTKQMQPLVKLEVKE